MSRKDRTKIAELEAKLFVYETALQAAGLRPLEIPPEPKGEMEFTIRKKKR